LKNDRVFILRESVVKITQMLSGKGIRVTQQGVNAYVKADHRGVPVLVNLPYLPDNAGEDLCNAIQGFLDHEVAHILFTDFPLMSEAMKHGKRTAFLLNALEDPRIEKCMAQRFQGSAYNLSTTGKFYLDKFVVPRMKEKAAAGDAMGVIETLIVPMVRAMSGQHVFQEFMKDKWTTVEPVYEKIKDLAPKIEAAGSTKDCLELAIEIGKRMSEGSTGGKGKDKSEDEDESGSGGTTAGGKSKGKPQKSKGKSKAKPEPKSEEEKEPEEGKGGAGGESDKDEEDGEGGGKSEDDKKGKDEKPEPTPGKDEEEGEDESGSEPEPETESDDESDVEVEDEPEPEEEDDGPASSASSAGESDDEEVTLDESQAIWEKLDKDGANDYDEAMTRIISDSTAKVAENADYLVFTKDYDVIEKLPIGSGYSPSMTKSLIDKTEHMVAPLQKDLERAIAARSLATRSHGHRSGRLHAANLSRLAFNDDRVFSRKQESTSKDVAVELVVDASGSMSGSKIHTASQAAFALSAVLDRIGIKNEVICFTTKELGCSPSEVSKSASAIGRSYSRMEALYMPILKGYEERMTTDVKERFGWLPNTRILRSNVDGESVEIAARRLMARREAGKIMLVLSDGYPAAAGNSADLNRHLKQKVKDIAASGVNVVGIGIQSDAVRQFYPKSLVLNNVEDLPSVVIKELRQLLIAP
jgi:cobaltochelatase CobT